MHPEVSFDEGNLSLRLEFTRHFLYRGPHSAHGNCCNIVDYEKQVPVFQITPTVTGIWIYVCPIMRTTVTIRPSIFLVYVVLCSSQLVLRICLNKLSMWFLLCTQNYKQFILNFARGRSKIIKITKMIRYDSSSIILCLLRSSRSSVIKT